MMNFFILVLFCRSQARRINKPRRSNIAVCFSLTALCVVRVCVCVCIKFFNKEVYRCWCSQIFFDVSQESEISPGVRLARRERTAAAFSHTPPLWYKCKIFFCFCVLAVRARERERKLRANSQLGARALINLWSPLFSIAQPERLKNGFAKLECGACK